MGIIEIVKKGFVVAAKSIGLVLILFVFNLVWNMASIPLAAGPGAAPTPQLTASAIILSVIFILISIFVQGGSLALVRDHVKEGKMKLGSFASYGLKYYLRLLGLGFFIVLIIAVFGLIAAVIVAATAPLNNVVVTTIAGIIAIVIGAIGLYAILLLILSPYALVSEELSIIESMKRSLALVRKAIGRVLLLLVVLILISLGIGFLLGFLTGLMTAALPVKVGQVLIGFVNSIFNGYLGVVMTASFMGYYLALAAEAKKGAGEKVF